jgi:signal transduction histidine kinase
VLGGAALGGMVTHFGAGPVAVATAIFLLVVWTSGLTGMRRITRPMANLSEAARKIEAGDYSARVPEYGSPDMRSVARAFNSMSARLKTIDEQRRDFLADVTHELRTPLSVIRGQAEGIADGVYPGDQAHLTPILDAAHAMERLVDDLRTLVQTDAGNLVLSKEPTDIETLVHDTVASFRSRADLAGVAMTVEMPEKAPMLEVDPTRIRAAIGNLLSNAIRHTPSGGWIKAAISSTAEEVTITIADSGEGIPADLLPRIFDRFVKGPGSNGSGLGLAIARHIITAHGGRLELANTSPSGVVARIALPIRT